MKNPLILSLSLIAFAGLAACGQGQSEGFNDTIADPMQDQLANAAPVDLPPPVKVSRTYRCKDNSLVFVDFFADDLGANVRTDKAAPPTRLTAPEKGQAFEGGGWKVESSSATTNITQPEKSAQSCKA